MDEKKMNELLEQSSEAVAKKFNAALEAANEGNKKAVDELKTALKNELGPESAHMKAIQEQLDAIMLEQKRSKEIDTTKSVSDHIGDFVASPEFKNVAEGRAERIVKSIPLQIKVGTMLNSGQSGVPRPMWVPGVSKTEDIPTFLAPLCNVGVTNSNTIYYVDRSARTVGAAVATEGNALGQSDMTYTQRSASVFDIGAFITISKQMVEDNDFVQNEIDAELRPQVLRKLDYDILNGTGTTTFDGLINRGTTFSVAGLGFANGIANANNFDVLRVAIGLARRSNFNPTAILVHPDDYGMMETTKDGSGAYVLPPFYGPGISISGVRVIPNTLITAGTFLVADMTKARLFMRQEMLIEAWYQHSDNATKRLLTITGYLRAGFYISAEHAAAFQNGTFSTAAAAILKP